LIVSHLFRIFALSGLGTNSDVNQKTSVVVLIGEGFDL